MKWDGVISKVKCKTCGAEHKYRGVKPPPKKSDPMREKKTKPGVAAKNTNTSVTMQWSLKQRNIEPGSIVKDYAMRNRYAVNDIIHHATFGLGFVERISSDKRMDVLFQDAVKSLAMNISA